jgi:hypothetical protein
VVGIRRLGEGPSLAGLHCSHSNFGDGTIGVGVGIGIDKTNGNSTPIPIPTPTPMTQSPHIENCWLGAAIQMMTAAIGIQIGIGTEIDEKARISTPISISTVQMCHN